MNSYVRSVVIVTVFSLVAFLGGFIKFGGAASIALDSWASFFVGAFFSPLLGGAVGLLGHALSAVSGGFPFGPPVHALVAVLQFVWAFLFGAITRAVDNLSGLFLASVVAVVGNGLVAPYVIGFVFPSLAPVMNTLIPILLAASAVNVVLASAVLLAIKRLRT